MVNQPHKYRCEMCKKFPCDDITRASETISNSIISGMISALLKEFTSKVGCASHSDATKAEQRIKDVIAKLEKDLKVGVGAYHKSGRHEQEYWKDRIEEALALLRGKGK